MVEFTRTSSERNNQRAADDYEGTVNGKPFRVQINEMSAPCWYDSDLDDDEKNEVLAAIDAE